MGTWTKTGTLVMSLLGILILAAFIVLAGIYALIIFDNGTITVPSTTSQRAPAAPPPPATQARAAPTGPTAIPGTPRPSLTPSPTWPPPPTNTLVIQPGEILPPLYVAPRTPTRSPNPYAIFVPTPTAAAALNGSVAFSNTLKVITYTVTGKTVNEISNSLETNALSDPHEPNSRFYARTDWYLSRQWTTRMTTRGCEVDRGDVTIAMTVTLPALANPTNLMPDVLNRWNTFLEKTVAHESEHVRINLNGARDLQREIGNLTPTANCDILNAQINALSRASAQTIDRAGIEYDQRTNHGLATGAVFP